MSVEAISRALNLARFRPAEAGSRPARASSCWSTWPTKPGRRARARSHRWVATLVRYTGLSERTVRTCLDRLQAAGIIWPCDPGIVAARIKRADRRPQGWDLNLSLVRDDSDDATVAALEHQFPGLASGSARPGRWAQRPG